MHSITMHMCPRMVVNVSYRIDMSDTVEAYFVRITDPAPLNGRHFENLKHFAHITLVQQL